MKRDQENWLLRARGVIWTFTGKKTEAAPASGLTHGRWLSSEFTAFIARPFDREAFKTTVCL